MNASSGEKLFTPASGERLRPYIPVWETIALQRDPAYTPNNDVGTALCSAALLDVMQEDINIQWAVNSSLLYRGHLKPDEEINPENYANHIQKAILQGIMHLPGFPFKTVKGYRNAIKQMFDDPASSENFIMAMGDKNVATNIEQRYAAVKLIQMALAPRFGQQVRCLDVGTSLGLGPKQLVLKNPQEHPLLPVSVHKVVKGEKTADETMTGIINGMLQQPYDAGSWLGIDTWWAYDPPSIEWAVSNRFRPDEYDPEEVEAYRAFIGRREEDVELKQLDILSEPDEVNEVLGEEPFQLGVLSMMIHQLKEKKQAQALETVMEHMDTEAVLVVTDFATRDKRTRTGLRTGGVGSPCNTLVLDMADKDAGWQPAFEWSSGRCTDVVVSKAGRLAIHPGGETYKMEELLYEAAQ